MSQKRQVCDLCGLRLRDHKIVLETQAGAVFFCCAGCRQVYCMLVESAEGGDPASFRDTEIFKRCQSMGIIPLSQEDLDKRQAKPPAEVRTSTTHREDHLDEPGESLPLKLKVESMWCPACAWVIERGLEKSQGVVQARCDFATDHLSCHYDPRSTSPDMIMSTVARLGYTSRPPQETGRDRTQRREFTRFAVSAFLTMNVMMLSFALYSGFFTDLPPDAVAKLSWPIFFLSTIVLVYGGGNILKRFWTGLFHISASMETLISIGALCAYGFSLVSLFTGSIHLYFDTTCMLITLVLLGKTLERRAKNRVQEGISAFFALQPNKVRLCSEAFPQGRFVALDAMEKGDRFVVEGGEVIPADGVILRGSAEVDEASLTGESIPQERKLHDHVRSGTIVCDGRIDVRAEAVGPESTLGQMKRLLEQALSEKTQLEGKTDRILQWFVPVMVFLASATAVVTYFLGMTWEVALVRAVSVLVVSCPCALGVAIPLARVAGISIAGKKGILVRDFLKFEEASDIDTFVFDKTGTVTRGAWTLLKIIPNGFDPDRILALAAGLEENSDHLIAREISRKAKTAGISPAQIRSTVILENGISGESNDGRITIGSLNLHGDEETLPQAWQSHQDTQPQNSYVGFWVEKEPAALFVFGDEAKKDASETAARLQTRGFHTVLLSGDGHATTQTVADQLGFKKALGTQSPEQKAAYVAKLQGQGHKTAMIGDGINDAPALAQADLAVTVHSGSSLDKEISHMTLMRDDLCLIPDFLDLATEVNKKIHQNLWFSFIYNTISIPAAMAGFLSPLVAVSAMLLSSLAVIGNTLHLIRKTRRPGHRPPHPTNGPGILDERGSE